MTDINVILARLVEQRFTDRRVLDQAADANQASSSDTTGR